MNADQFATALAALCPSEEELSGRGESPERMLTVRGRYLCVAREGSKTLDEPILDLVNRYDCSKVRIGMFQFAAHMEDVGDAWRIGKDEADGVVVDKYTDEVRVQDLPYADYVISQCAQTGSSFLDAMLLCARALRILGQEDPKRKNQERCRALANECVDAAGGPTYASYYWTLIGCS